jgi:hypothetical protein
VDEDGDGVLNGDDECLHSSPPNSMDDYDGDGCLNGGIWTVNDNDEYECNGCGDFLDEFTCSGPCEWLISEEDESGMCIGGGNCVDADDDGDGALDYVDSQDANEFVCSDLDGDGCDDCSLGTFDVDNDGIDADENGLCDSYPSAFSFNQSSYQAFYYVEDILDIHGEPLTAADWILAFTDDGVCVGMRQWNDQGMNDIPVMGYDNNTYSEGYMGIGEEPIFKVYDESEQEYFTLHHLLVDHKN